MNFLELIGKNNMKGCKMNIKQKSNRPFDFQKAKKEVYEPCDITLKCRKEFN